jgi:hypothetical protein
MRVRTHESPDPWKVRFLGGVIPPATAVAAPRWGGFSGFSVAQKRAQRLISGNSVGVFKRPRRWARHAATGAADQAQLDFRQFKRPAPGGLLIAANSAGGFQETAVSAAPLFPLFLAMRAEGATDPRDADGYSFGCISPNPWPRPASPRRRPVPTSPATGWTRRTWATGGPTSSGSAASWPIPTRHTTCWSPDCGESAKRSCCIATAWRRVRPGGWWRTGRSPRPMRSRPSSPSASWPT